MWTLRSSTAAGKTKTKRKKDKKTKEKEKNTQEQHSCRQELDHPGKRETGGGEEAQLQVFFSEMKTCLVSISKFSFAAVTVRRHIKTLKLKR